MASDGKALALAAKERGNNLFAKKTRESYEQALAAYEEAIVHDPDEHVFYANCSACHIELGNETWEPSRKVASFARALAAARECTMRGPTWVKGYVRCAAAEFDLLGAVVKWEERKKQDEKWKREEEERAEKDRKEGREPFVPPGKEFKDPELEEALKDVVKSASYSSCEDSCRKGLEIEASNALLRTRLQSLRDAGHATDEVLDKGMVDTPAAAAMKAKGNLAFSAKTYKEAIDFYTQALEQDPFDHVFYSNRSACYAESDDFDRSLRDAERCIAINPQFAKGYSRQAHALFHVGRYMEMEAAAKKGLELDSASAALQDLLKQAETETKEPLAVQQHMYKLRQEKKKDVKLQELMRGINMQGSGMQMFGPGAGFGGMGGGDLSGLLSGLGGGGGGGADMFGGGGNGKARMTEDQMRGMARAMSQNPNAGAGYTAAAPATAAAAVAASAEPVLPEGPSSLAPK